MSLHSLDDVLAAVLSQQNKPERLCQSLEQFANQEVGETMLASLLPDNLDPLEALDPFTNTLGYLLARLNVPNAIAPSGNTLSAFCKTFDPVQARLAPKRVNALAKSIFRHYEGLREPSAALDLILDLLNRYPTTSNHLTSFHSPFVVACVTYREFHAALPILSNSITEVDMKLSPELSYNDSLVYHYAGGVVHSSLKRWKEAEEFFDISVSTPHQAISSIQLEAYKKLCLVQLIRYGKLPQPPKYHNPNISRMLRNTPYQAFISQYPLSLAALKSLVEKESQFFAQETNLGLIQQALHHASRWSIRQLTATYATLRLDEIAASTSFDNVEEVQSLILSMVEHDEIVAIFDVDKTVTFLDPTPVFTKASVDSVLRDAQNQTHAFVYLDKELQLNKEFLTKASKDRDGGGSWGPGADEMSAGGMMYDETLF